MKILFVAPQPFFQHRGTPIDVKLMAEQSVFLGHAIDLLVFPEGEDSIIPGVTILRVWRIPFVKNIPVGPSWKKLLYDILLSITMVILVIRKKYDMIHATEEAAFMAACIHRFTGIPYIYDMDSCMSDQLCNKYPYLKWFSKLMQKCEHWAIQHSLCVMPVCSALTDFVKKYDAHKMVFQLDDISLLEEKKATTVVPEQVDLKKHFNITGPLFLYIGNLEKYQGIDLLIESFQRVAASAATPHLVIIGGDTAKIVYYEAKIVRLGIQSRVHFLSNRPIEQLGFYLGQADFLTAPRIQGENTPMKIYSYLASGKPIIATNLKTHTQVLDDTVAVLANPDPRCFAEAMLLLLGDPERARAIAANAAIRAEQKHSRKVFNEKVNHAYSWITQTLQKK